MAVNRNAMLANVLWIGGAADSGKTTIARILSERYGFGLYQYDQHDRPHHEKLAETEEVYQRKLTASLEENWIHPEPQDLFHRSVKSFKDRFPLVIEDLAAYPQNQTIIAEGFGFLPELLVPLYLRENQAIWLVSTISFKKASMDKRDKPSFKSRVSDPQKAFDNFLTRDLLLAGFIRDQVEKRNLPLLEIDGSRTAEQVAELVREHFQLL